MKLLQLNSKSKFRCSNCGKYEHKILVLGGLEHVNLTIWLCSGCTQTLLRFVGMYATYIAVMGEEVPFC